MALALAGSGSDLEVKGREKGESTMAHLAEHLNSISFYPEPSRESSALTRPDQTPTAGVPHSGQLFGGENWSPKYRGN